MTHTKTMAVDRFHPSAGTRMPPGFRWILVAACMGAVWMIHMLPLALHGTEDLAARVAKFQVLTRVAQAAGGERPSQRELETRALHWIEQNPAAFEAERAAAATRFQATLRYTAADGHDYPYLGDEDSYTWLRAARNYLQTGTTCDALVDGECRDTYVNAPLGTQNLYHRSLHISAIAALQMIVRRFKPQYPLAATSFWIPVIIGTLGVLPAFSIGYRLAGNLGGVAAALLVSVHPILLDRSIGSDNDIWNVVLPLFMNAAALAALATPVRWQQVAWAAIAGAVVGLHAVTWSGWVFTYAVVTVALLANLFVRLAQLVLHRTRPPSRNHRKQSTTVESTPAARPWQVSELASAGLVLLVFYVSAGLAVTLAGTPGYFSVPLGIMHAALPQSSDASGNTGGGLWPNVLATVSELKHTGSQIIVDSTYSASYFFVALLGSLVSLLPRRRWDRRHVAVLAVGSAFFLLVTQGGLGQFAILALAATPLGAAIALRLWSADIKESDDLGGALLVSAWFLAGVQVAFGGKRLLLLLVPGAGIAAAVAIGRLYEQAVWLAERILPRFRFVTSSVLALLFAAVLIPPVQRGYDSARSYLPAMNDAWWDTLINLRDRTAPDAIINTWWDYGYWVKYAAERRVTADGATLRTHLPYWLGRALVSATERESVGLLRMLNCGSDATPLPEGRSGAFGKIVGKVGDEVAAQAMVVDLASLDRPAAAAYLAQHGFTTAEQDDVLSSTHCTPPESYLVISTELAAKDSWMRLGLWDFRKAYLARQAGGQPQAAVVADVVNRFGYSTEEATALYMQARTLPYNDFVVGPAPRAPSNWYPCNAGRDALSMHCPLGLFDTASKKIVEEFVFDVFAPEKSTFRYRQAEPGRAPGPPMDITPAALILADTRVRDIPLPTPRYAETGILMDARHWRILVGPPPLLRSTFTNLLYLDGRYAKHFVKFDEHVSYMDDHVVTWKVQWDDAS